MSKVTAISRDTGGHRRAPSKKPINWLTNSDQPSDVIHAARSVVKFISNSYLSNAADRERASALHESGLVYVLMMVSDAMEYAEDLCNHARLEAGGAA